MSMNVDIFAVCTGCGGDLEIEDGTRNYSGGITIKVNVCKECEREIKQQEREDAVECYKAEKGIED